MRLTRVRCRIDDRRRRERTTCDQGAAAALRSRCWLVRRPVASRPRSIVNVNVDDRTTDRSCCRPTCTLREAISSARPDRHDRVPPARTCSAAAAQLDRRPDRGRRCRHRRSSTANAAMRVFDQRRGHGHDRLDRGHDHGGNGIGTVPDRLRAAASMSQSATLDARPTARRRQHRAENGGGIASGGTLTLSDHGGRQRAGRPSRRRHGAAASTSPGLASRRPQHDRSGNSASAHGGRHRRRRDSARARAT